MSKKPELEVGQTIFVESVGWVTSERREPKPYEITKVNSTSIYAKMENSDYEQRFDKKTWTSKGSLTTDYIWSSLEEYRKVMKQIENKKTLQASIVKELPNLSVEQLQHIAEQLNITIDKS